MPASIHIMLVLLRAMLFIVYEDGGGGAQEEEQEEEDVFQDGGHFQRKDALTLKPGGE